MCLDLIGLKMMCLYTNVDDRVIYQVGPLNHLFRSLQCHMMIVQLCQFAESISESGSVIPDVID